MTYKENPKTAGSGIFCAIPQTRKCPIGCKGCFFQSGRSYLEPLEKNLPNIPDPDFINKNGYIVRMNDGNDSNIDKEKVIAVAEAYDNVFFNTSIGNLDFPGPVVLTVNPAKKTNTDYIRVPDPIPKNLMFVRIRANTWNMKLVDDAIGYYSQRNVPIVLTFMAYDDINDVPESERPLYPEQSRTTNKYFAISHETWNIYMQKYMKNPWVHSCGRYACVKWEGGQTGCKSCGNCLREYFNTKVRMNGN